MGRNIFLIVRFKNVKLLPCLQNRNSSLHTSCAEAELQFPLLSILLTLLPYLPRVAYCDPYTNYEVMGVLALESLVLNFNNWRLTAVGTSAMNVNALKPCLALLDMVGGYSWRAA